MTQYTKSPILSGKQLIKLLVKDSWEVKRRAKHGVSLAKLFPDRTRVTVVPDSKAPLDDGTLSAILGVKQTGIGKRGLLDLINKYGL